MKRLLNTLYVTTQNSYLAREGDTVLVRVDKETRLRVPIHNLGGIVCFGVVSASPPLMELCASNGVLLSFMTEYGKFLARVEGAVSGNVLLRREQYRRADDLTASAEIARSMVAAKVINCRTALLRAVRDHHSGGRKGATEPAEPLETGETAETGGEEIASFSSTTAATTTPVAGAAATEIARAAACMEHVLRVLKDPLPLDVVRGREGEAASAYFSVFDHLITSQKSAFFFRERSRRPPLDAMNALLSFLYVMLAHDVSAALEGVGLDPAVGFLHRDRPGRKSLALDVMEELRPVLAERVALSLVNRQQVKGKGFKTTEAGGIVMDDDTRKEVLTAWQKRKQEVITHPFLGEKIALGLVPHVQAMLLARHLRGDLDAYPPFVWR